jgi:hypothetical protein
MIGLSSLKICSIGWATTFLLFVGHAQAEQVTRASLLKAAHTLTKVTSELRGLRKRKKIAMGVMTRNQILDRIKRRLAEEYTKEDIRAESEVLKTLGLLPPEMNYEQAVLKLLTSQVAGFYDPRDGQLNLADWLPLAMQKPALVHELCHALQDQHFQLLRFVKPIKDNADTQLARSAIVEGDCTGVMVEYMIKPMGQDLSSTGPLLEQLIGQITSATAQISKSTPHFLKSTLIFPYAHGLRFVAGIRQKNAWSAIDQVFRRMPETTEQVLHLDKYAAREQAKPVRPRTPPSLTTHHRLKADTLGEFQLRAYFEAHGLSDAIAERAAAGWGGVRLRVHQWLWRPADLALQHLG